MAPMKDLKDAELQDIVDVNLVHPVSFIKILVDIMKKRNDKKKVDSDKISVDLQPVVPPKQTSGIMIITS